MDQDLRKQILDIIESARLVREEALQPGNEKTQGYPYAAGYANSALLNIRNILEVK